MQWCRVLHQTGGGEDILIVAIKPFDEALTALAHEFRPNRLVLYQDSPDAALIEKMAVERAVFLNELREINRRFYVQATCVLL